MEGIEKIKSFSEDYIKSQIKYIMCEEDSMVFVAFLKKIKDFAKLSADKIHTILIDLAFYKSQIQKFEAQVRSAKEKEKIKATQAAMQKAKSVGLKVTENTIVEFLERNNNYENLVELHAIAESWKDYMSDIYFMCQQTNKIIGDFN